MLQSKLFLLSLLQALEPQAAEPAVQVGEEAAEVQPLLLQAMPTGLTALAAVTVEQIKTTVTLHLLPTLPYQVLVVAEAEEAVVEVVKLPQAPMVELEQQALLGLTDKS
jgi:hypothetical protein